jgi:DNA (cytosine-5)-methyltransferase 1
MNYLSVCSGIEAATVAWHPLGWRPFAFAEIEKFPSAVLAHHYPSVPNLGDMTKFKDWPDAAIDVLVGGTPCQSFSVAGLRKGLADPRGNLALTYLALVDRYRPEWFIWENVPGVLSSDDGRDFGALLGGMAELRYGWAYRVLDAQYVRVDGFGRAVPQRRRRVFVVGNSRDCRRSAAVLFEPESLSGDIAPRRQAGERIAPTISARPSGGGGLGTDFDCDGGLIASTGDVAHCLNAGAMGRIDYETETMVAHTLCADGFDASEDGTGRGTPLVPVIPFDTTQITSPTTRGNNKPGDPCHTLSKGAHAPAIAFDTKASGRNGFGIGSIAPTLRAMGHTANSHTNAGGQIGVAFDMRGREGGSQFEGPHDTANIRAASSGGSSKSYVAQSWAVRRLTPRECERLQGFPDDYTLVPYRGKPAADGPRYKALGNSMAVNCMRWLGRRIDRISSLTSGKQEAEVK